MTAGEMVAPTQTLEQAAKRVWDVLVVGAGPSGALAAREVARDGASVLLVDKAAFPRQKVCGGCLNAAALAILEVLGLGQLPVQLGARPIRELRLTTSRCKASIPLPAGAALSREVFDTALVEHAILSGAHFLPGTLAALDGGDNATRRLMLRNGREAVAVHARVVLVADGLGGKLLQHEQSFALSVARNSRVGVGTIVEAPPSFYRVGTIFMACGIGGYVGLVQVEGGQLDIAAALDPWFVRQAGGPGKAVTLILDQAGLPRVNGLLAMAWRGTPALTYRRPCLAAERLFVLGDAAGYAEPFTGEGIAWALTSGVAVAPLALEAVQRWTPSLAAQWTQRYRRLVGRRQRVCRLVTGLLRRVALTRAAVSTLSQVPILAMPLVRYLNSPLPIARYVSKLECATSS